MSLFAELKRRNVIKVSAAYLALGWVVTQVTGTIAPALHLPDWTIALVVWIGVIGFPFVVVFSWVFELTPEGLKRESEIDRSQSITQLTGKRLDYIIIGMLGLAMLLFVADRFVPEGARPDRDGIAAAAGSARDLRARGTEPPDSRGQDPPAPKPALAPSQKSIAVLPFTNMSSDAEQAYFSDGLAEELLNLLARIPDLKVAARTSSFSYKGKDARIADIARELNVAHVLEGSVRKSGDRVRITAQLIQAADGYHLWSQSWDRDLDDIFAVQDEIASAVVGQLKITLLGEAPKARQTDPKAYELFLLARQLGRQGTAEGFEQAIALFQQALAIDPGYAAAWAELARVYTNQAGASALRPADEGFRLARETANRALAIDPEFAPAHSSLGYIAATYDGDLAAAARHYLHALALEPANPDILGGSAIVAQILGRLDQAVRLGEIALVRDPLNPTRHANLAIVYRWSGRVDEAIARSHTALNLSPRRINASNELGMALLAKGEKEAALQAVEQETSEPNRQFGLAIVHQALGQGAESDAALGELVRQYGERRAFAIAAVYARRGEAEQAFEWLEKAVVSNKFAVSWIVLQPELASLHQDPRWLPLLRRLGKAPEQLAAIEFDVVVPDAAR